MPQQARGTFQFSLNYDVNLLQTLKAGTEVLDDDSRERKTQSVMLGINYGFTDRFSMDGFFSFVNQQRTITPDGLPVDFTETNGIGDAVLLFKYKLTPIQNLTHQFIFGLGFKLPTGKSDISKDGITLNADLQPGSGAWDGIFWGNYIHNFKSRPSMNLISTLTFRLTGKNSEYFGSQIYELGDEFQLRAGVSDRFIIGKVVIDPSVTFRYRFADNDINDGFELPNTGGQWVLVIPAINYNILPNLSVNLTAEFPIYAQVDGTQLSPTSRFNIGLFYKLNLKQSNKYDLLDLSQNN
jgi:hypothetical protein